MDGVARTGRPSLSSRAGRRCRDALSGPTQGGVAPPHVRRRRVRTGLLVAAVLAVLAANLVVEQAAGAIGSPSDAASSTTSYPIGTFDLSEPSAYAPPGPHQLAGYTEAYVDDFTGPRNLSGRWGRFSGTPKGDPAGRFVPDHVWSRDGELRIGTWRDPADHDRWATGGVCLCGVHPTYGAFFVRSRQTTAGPDVAELPRPANNAWPPELDFNETGTSPDASTWTDHYTSPSTEVQATTQIDVEHWHTWGVVWTPTSVTFVVDGRAWGEVTSPAQIPDVAMTLDLQQQTWCGLQPECPTRDSTLLVDWVAIYTPTS